MKRSTNPDRLPPHSIEAEQGVLGCILLDPVNSFAKASQAIGSAEVFYDLRHQMIYDAIAKHMDTGAPLDVHTLMVAMKQAGTLEAVGGVTFLSALPDAVPSAANLDFYLGKLLKTATLRRLLQTLTRLSAEVYEGDPENTLIDQAEREIMAVRGSSGKGYRSLKQIVPETLDKIEEMYRRGQAGIIGGISTGLERLDWATDGLHKGHVWVVAGRTSDGKTALTMTIADNIAIDQQIPVGVFSMEMPDEELVRRIVLGRAGLNSRDVRKGVTNPSTAPQEALRVAKGLMVIDDTGGLTLGQLRAKARRMVQAEGVKVLVVDYIQLMHAETNVGNRTEALDYLSGGIKSLALELRIPIIVIAQLNTDGGIRGCGKIAMDSDVVMKLKESGKPTEGGIQKMIGMLTKVRGGEAMQEIPFAFCKTLTRYMDWENQVEE